MLVIFGMTSALAADPIVTEFNKQQHSHNNR